MSVLQKPIDNFLPHEAILKYAFRVSRVIVKSTPPLEKMYLNFKNLTQDECLFKSFLFLKNFQWKVGLMTKKVTACTRIHETNKSEEYKSEEKDDLMMI